MGDDLQKRTQSAPLNDMMGFGGRSELLEKAKSTGPEKSSSAQDVSLAASFGALKDAAKDVIKEGPVGPQNLNKMVYEGRTMERGE